MIRFGAVNTDNEIVYTNIACKLKINNGDDERGELFLTKSEICWKRGPETGFMIPWDKITVQAITLEPQRSVYFMIDVGWPESVVINNGAENGNGAIENHEEDGSEDEGNASECSLQEMTEFHLIPENGDDIDEIYYIMTKFPEVAEDMEDDDDDFFDGENMDQMNLNEDDERFADAE